MRGYYHMIDDFMENYRLLHITMNPNPHIGLMRETTYTVEEWMYSVALLKVMGTGKLL